MFWSTTYSSLSSSKIEELLKDPPVDMKEILEQEDVIQECKNQNKSLIDYLCQPEQLSRLIDLIISEPSVSLSEAERFKLPNIAAEILTCEVRQITDKISGDETLLERLYSFMASPAPLNPLLSSFFSKAFGVFWTRKSDQNWYNYQVSCLQVLQFLKKKDLVSDLVRHIGTSAISDFIIGLITGVDGDEIKQGNLTWLNENKLIESIIGLLDPNYDRDTHDNASRLLIEILRVSRDGQYASVTEKCDDPLLTTLENPATVKLLMETILKKVPDKKPTEDKSPEGEEGEETKNNFNESSITNGVEILLTLLETSMSQVDNYTVMVASDTDTTKEELDKQRAILDCTISAICPWVPELAEILRNPPTKEVINTTIGKLEPPFGMARYSVTKLITVLLSTNKTEVFEKIRECGAVDILLDLFFKYSLNNFLHSQVEKSLGNIFNFKPCQQPPPTSNEKPSKSSGETSTTPTNPEEKSRENEDESGGKTCDKSDETKSEEEKMAEDIMKAVAEIKTTADNTAAVTAATAAETTEEPMETDEVKPAAAETEEEDQTELKANPLLTPLLKDYRLFERILEAWEDNEAGEKQNGYQRKGYMGHLTKIANLMIEFSETTDSSKSFFASQLQELPGDTETRWSEFVENQLKETNEKNKIVKIGYRNHASSSEDDDADFRDIHFTHDSALQQMFSDYQMQQMSEHFIDSFGFRDDEFSKDDESSSPSKPRLATSANFGLDDDLEAEEEREAADKMFESVCNSRTAGADIDLGGFGNDTEDKETADPSSSSSPGDEKIDEAGGDGEVVQEDDDDPWAERTKEISFDIKKSSSSGTAEGENACKKQKSDENPTPSIGGKGTIPVLSSSSEEDEETLAEGGVSVTPMDTSNPWESNVDFNEIASSSNPSPSVGKKAVSRIADNKTETAEAAETTPAAAAADSSPASAAIPATGDSWVADFGNADIVTCDPETTENNPTTKAADDK